ncbi:MAG: aldehyde dehydrogenase family protein, partial [Acidimicrobiales bacterium]|nr:aldehyde dehydrogenase family protein [Acidimicrobiales bacterium]
GVITPWNFPVEIILNKIGPVLAMGNTMVLKPAPDTPFNANWIGRIIAEKTDIPAGVVNILNAREHAVGELITGSPLVDMVAFTGSTATGRRIMQVASETLKQVFLELGGKSVLLAMPDADAESASAAAAGMCMHAGQGCAMTTRFLVPRARYAEFVDAVAAKFAQVPYGDPTDFSNLMGPQVSRRQQERVLGYLEQGKAEGARAVVGGGRPAHLPTGFFVEPTLFADVDNSMTIAREEIFGPVQVVIPYDDVDDAVRIANDSTYGLSGSIMGPDLEASKAVARRIRTGTLSINGGVWYGADAPFGGYKQSGIGRQCGIEGLEIFTETKTVGWPV